MPCSNRGGSADTATGDPGGFTFDTALTSLHSYLGEVEDVRGGRTVLEGGATLRLPMFYLEGLVLFPEQTLPLRVIQPRFKAAVVRAMERSEGQRILGVVHMSSSTRLRRGIRVSSVGTTAEIRQLLQLEDGSLNVLTRGAQRFYLCQAWTETDGSPWAQVQVMVEDQPTPIPRDAFAPLACVPSPASGTYAAKLAAAAAGRESCGASAPVAAHGKSSARGRRSGASAAAAASRRLWDDEDDLEEQEDRERARRRRIRRMHDELLLRLMHEEDGGGASGDDDGGVATVESSSGSGEESQEEERGGVGGDNRGANWWWWSRRGGLQGAVTRQHSGTGGTGDAEVASDDARSNGAAGSLDGRRASGQRKRGKAPAVEAEASSGGGSTGAGVASPGCAWREDGRRWRARAPLAAWPHWVYRMYDAYDLARRVADLYHQLTQGSPPLEASLLGKPQSLSFHVASNLPLSDSARQVLLEMEGTVYRLQKEVRILENMERLRCKACKLVIARRGDVLAMSSEGLVSAFVNAHGYVHETVTLRRARGLVLEGPAEVENSWFPGYSWTIAHCGACGTHVGWRFTAVRRGMTPEAFWGVRTCQLASLREHAEVLN
eukprot:SM000064S19818  [mRNA]  locus=s64:540139:544359:- [translate_table: standard]